MAAAATGSSSSSVAATQNVGNLLHMAGGCCTVSAYIILFFGGKCYAEITLQLKNVIFKISIIVFGIMGELFFPHTLSP
jgi:hypothetical protein